MPNTKEIENLEKVTGSHEKVIEELEIERQELETTKKN